MKISKILHHGKIRYRVNDPHGTDGKRLRKFFETREAADAYVKERTADPLPFRRGEGSGRRNVVYPTHLAVFAAGLPRAKGRGCDRLVPGARGSSGKVRTA